MKDIENKRVVSCVGLGYVGLPTAVVLASEGVTVWGYDINQKAVNMINQGKAHIQETDLDALLKQVVTNGNLVADTKPHTADAFLIAVPTPFKADKTPDMSYVISAIQSIAPVVEKGNIIILESTSPVGSTEMIRDVLQKERPDLFHGHKQSDVYFAYCPERILPGNTLRELRENSRCIGGLTSEAAKIAADLYKNFCDGELFITNARTSEMVKLSENSFRDVNIAYANELSKICHDNNVDVHECVALANHHPRVHILSPGIGVGGHCIPVDPWFLIADNPDQAQLLRQSRDINDQMPAFYIERLKEILHDQKTAKIALLGLTYKPDVDDFRCSPAIDLLNLLVSEQNFTVTAHDFFLEHLTPNMRHPHVSYCETIKEALENADCIIIATPHAHYKNYDFSRFITQGKFIDPSGVIYAAQKINNAARPVLEYAS